MHSSLTMLITCNWLVLAFYLKYWFTLVCYHGRLQTATFSIARGMGGDTATLGELRARVVAALVALQLPPPTDAVALTDVSSDAGKDMQADAKAGADAKADAHADVAAAAILAQVLAAAGAPVASDTSASDAANPAGADTTGDD